ncbi:integral membrane protein [Asticcacaulis biprosthecium C19]|uniref:Integral membrane protein n=1 Tax=Asticcacaulis biprosthecium C19 TaxID=715226 RepID=F4QI57_9CAUL|nr:fused MFS/spermidine synthase [Asticcacaulis biprosthecium]EGF92924.1 integral membrane protein [Asticcacaulis biprosthecium C19]
MPSSATAPPLPVLSRPPALFVVTVFTSAFLVFFVQPMVGKLLLPLLGGAPAVWNTSMAFFQAALLVGYGYAHLLQKIKAFKTQVLVHGIMLALAGLTLPLHVTGLLGQPDPEHPAIWLLGVLTLSIGAPFAVLSATAPLVQAWFSRTADLDPASGKPSEPYSLYAASNLGSLLSLLAYPILVEPLTQLTHQRLGWSLGYGVLAAMIILLGLTQKARTAAAEHDAVTPRPGLLTMARWVALAAIPSSLMIGVTTYLSTDVATAPFLWVIPLALYLVTFILAFATRRVLSRKYLLLAQAMGLGLCLYLLPLHGTSILLHLGVHLLCFFLTAWMCHDSLALARPAPDHLTLYYLCLSLGGVIGGGFNAFIAPVIFDTIFEYILILALSCAARPWGGNPLTTWPRRDVIWFALGVAATLTLMVVPMVDLPEAVGSNAAKLLFALAIVTLVALNHRGVLMATIAVLAAIALQMFNHPGNLVESDRNFFGVIRVADTEDQALGPIREMIHGTTLHGAQRRLPGQECQPLTYYGPATAIGQSFALQQIRSPAIDVATVGLGVGTVATYVRPGDRLTFYEIDPEVVRIARNPERFTFISDCAKGSVDFRTGDARLTLAPLPAGELDLLLVDAFTSDAVPAHLLTAEAIAMYLSKLSDDGVVVFHLSNRHLELRSPVIAAVRQAGGKSVTQVSPAAPEGSRLRTASIVVVAGKGDQALAPFHADPRWEGASPGGVKAWTDDYMNVIGAMFRPQY